MRNQRQVLTKSSQRSLTRKIFHFLTECECDVDGSVDGECISNSVDGCRCKEGYTGKFCDACKPGYFGFPNCERKFYCRRLNNLLILHLL